MKTLIVYMSATGNTKTLAEAAFDVLSEPKAIFPLKEAPDHGSYDLICVGLSMVPIEQPNPKVMQYLRTIQGKDVLVFFSHGTANDTPLVSKTREAIQEAAAGAHLLGVFDCQGEVDLRVVDRLKQRNPPPCWLKHAPAAQGHPDAYDLARFSEFLKTTVC